MPSSYAQATVRVSVSATVAISRDHPIAIHEVAHACGASIEWVVQLVEIGIVNVSISASPPETWRFHSADLQNALEVRRLERDFGVGLEAAALILDLQHEVRRLKAALLTQRR
nr:chaperone modulator CbpM [Rhodoferax sp.]